MLIRFEPKQYCRPQNLAEALEIMGPLGSTARVLAGGTDLLVQKPKGIQCLVDLSRLGLDYIHEEESIHIGATTTVNTLLQHPRFSSGPFQVLAEAAAALATATIRNTATIGGNICNASPAADLALALMVLDAVLIVVGPGGEREIPIASFFIGVGQTALQPAELLTEIRLPPIPTNTGTCFLKLRRHQTAIDIAVVNVATRLTLRRGQCEYSRIVMGAVAPTPIYALRAQAELVGKKAAAGIIQQAAQTAAAETRPIDDIRASAQYRRNMAAILVRRALETSLRRCSL